MPKHTSKPNAPAVFSQPVAPEQPEPDALNSEDQAFLDSVRKFLTVVIRPIFAVRAMKEGYSAEEHQIGRDLFKKANGLDRPVDHFFVESDVGANLTGVDLPVLRAIDHEENRWFPRIRDIIPRVVPRDQRDAFVAGFFKDLKQQPLGLGVLDSMTGLCNRVEGLKNSNQPHAKAVYEAVSKRGFNAAKIKQIREMIDSVQQGNAQPATTAVDPEVVRTAQLEQREALEDLRDWFRDWGTTLRPIFNVREQLMLGLTTLKRTAASEQDVVDNPPAGATPSGAPVPVPNR